MSAPSRTSLIAKLYRVLKQRYKAVQPDGQQTLLEHMLFACCLENANYDKAEKTYRHLVDSFFDWNEVRVSTVKELAEAMRGLPEPTVSASNLKRLLQTVFESTYSFELESVKKQNIGAGIKKLGKLDGSTPFIVGYTTQHALGGHAIPLDRGALEVLYIVGIATDAERTSGVVAGLERAIPKNKGNEFGSLLHQLVTDYVANPNSANVRNLLLSVNSTAKLRFPKRGQKALPEPPPTVSAKALAAKEHAKVVGKDGKKGKAPMEVAGKSAAAGARSGKPAAKEKRAARMPARAGRPSGKSSHKQLASRKPR